MPTIARPLLPLTPWLAAALACSAAAPQSAPTTTTIDAGSDPASFDLERITTRVPFPRGLALVNDKLFVLSRGRVRESGGVSRDVLDQAGTIWEVDPLIGQPLHGRPSEAVRANGRTFAVPTEPPFRLWDRNAEPPTADRRTDRPYCSLRYHEPTHSFYLCAFSGIDKPERKGENPFSKNLSDAVLRYDTRTAKWYEVERHDIEAGGSYPHHDPAAAPPPHGWLNGPDNCLAVNDSLYVVAKDNSVLVRYDLSRLVADPEAQPPPSQLVLDENIELVGLGAQRLLGHSMLAEHDGYLYIGYRTSSVIVRIKLDERGLPVRPITGELVARFAPYDATTRTSANLTDMVFDRQGNLYVVSAKPSRVHRFRPDPDHVYDARDRSRAAWLDLAALTGNAEMKSENVLVDAEGRVYVTSGDAYDFQSGAGGVVYRATPRRSTL
ncbi:MAG: hypothetical protein U1E76_15760 [Planctomycetota bacterium]